MCEYRFPMCLISIVVPIFNVGAYLHQCISSILGQTYQHLEVILVDDGSTDNSREICEYFRKTDARIKVIEQSNSGLVSARKAGVNATTGEYVFYVDGDDWIEPDCLSQYCRLAEAHDADMVIGDYKREFLGKFEILRNLICTGVYNRNRIEQEIFPTMISHGPFFNHGLKTYSWGKLYKRSLILNLQNEVPNEVFFPEDSALFYPSVVESQTIVISEMALYNYRQRPGSIIRTAYPDNLERERVAFSFRYLSDALCIRQSKYSFGKQLQDYFAATITIRSGAFFGDIETYKGFQVFGPLEPGVRLAIYNSGSFGQHVYRHLEKNSIYSLVGWYDKDYRENVILKMPVRNPDLLSDELFDYLLVPSFDPLLKFELNQLCARRGLNPAKIRFVDLDSDRIESFIIATGYDPRTFKPLSGSNN